MNGSTGNRKGKKLFEGIATRIFLPFRSFLNIAFLFKRYVVTFLKKKKNDSVELTCDSLFSYSIFCLFILIQVYNFFFLFLFLPLFQYFRLPMYLSCKQKKEPFHLRKQVKDLAMRIEGCMIVHPIIYIYLELVISVIYKYKNVCSRRAIDPLLLEFSTLVFPFSRRDHFIEFLRIVYIYKRKQDNRKLKKKKK